MVENFERDLIGVLSFIMYSIIAIGVVGYGIGFVIMLIFMFILWYFVVYRDLKKEYPDKNGRRK